MYTADLLHVLSCDIPSISRTNLLFLLMTMATTALPPMTPEYMNANRGPAFVAVFSAGLAVAIVLVALRLWVRFKVVRKVGADDYVMLASMVSKNQFLRCNLQRDEHARAPNWPAGFIEVRMSQRC